MPKIPPHIIPMLQSSPPDLPHLRGILCVEYTSINGLSRGYRFWLKSHNRGVTHEELTELGLHVDRIAERYAA
jgi:hypothetical protein